MRCPWNRCIFKPSQGIGKAEGAAVSQTCGLRPLSFGRHRWRLPPRGILSRARHSQASHGQLAGAAWGPATQHGRPFPASGGFSRPACEDCGGTEAGGGEAEALGQNSQGASRAGRPGDGRQAPGSCLLGGACPCWAGPLPAGWDLPSGRGLCWGWPCPCWAGPLPVGWGFPLLRGWPLLEWGPGTHRCRDRPFTLVATADCVSGALGQNIVILQSLPQAQCRLGKPSKRAAGSGDLRKLVWSARPVTSHSGRSV